MPFTFGQELGLWLALYAAVFGLTCVISSGHPTSTLYLWGLQALRLSLLLFVLVLISLPRFPTSSSAPNP